MNFLSKVLSSFFGKKSDRDIKAILPIVNDINAIYEKLKDISNDELRAKSAALKKKVRDYISEEEEAIKKLKTRLDEELDMDIKEKENIYKEIDNLTKISFQKTKEILDEVLPEAFAIVKETARRFKENEELYVKATDYDREFATKYDFVKIEGDTAIYFNSWMAGGNKIVWDMVHYDVQLIGGIVLHQGKIAEMATGEGKTLVATLPVFLNALAGKGVHVVTVNDYLAKRDSEWMGPLYMFHGLTVECIDKYEPHSEARKNAYYCDITYGTNSEFGFDYLRDNMSRSLDELVQRGHYYAIVDEVDSVLIDDARTPLIISGPVPKGDNHEFNELKPYVERLVNAQKNYVISIISEAKELLKKGNEKDAGFLLLRAHRGLPKNKALIKLQSEPGVKTLLQKTENFYLQENAKNMPIVDSELFFVIDEKNQTIELTDKGIDFLSKDVADPKFFILPDIGTEMAEIEKSNLSEQEKLMKKNELLNNFTIKSERIHTMNQLLRAYTLFERDVQYVVLDNKIKIVDEQTGRILEGRRYSDGLHQAIEAKENVKVEAATQTFATITLQNYFRMYKKLAGMTGTAETEAAEFWDIYKLDVVVIPTNKPVIRIDYEDLVYKTAREKYNAVIEEITRLVKIGRPVLVGTTSVEVSELLSKMLTLRKIKHNVLNAKHHAKEAQIVAEAGKAGTVTIATNMAGRGTDIKLGPGVKELGGLAIIGTERHESRRVDRQLRGRAGRQGDPGSSQFFVSLEDNLMRLFGSERIAKIMDTLGLKEGEVIQHKMITKSIERAQKKVEENNFGIRKRLLEYDDVMNSQREVIYTKRRNALYGDKLAIDISNMLYDLISQYVEDFQNIRDFEGFKYEIIKTFGLECPITEEEFFKKDIDEITEYLYKTFYNFYNKKREIIANNAYPLIEYIYFNNPQQYENMVIPFSDGHKGIQIYCNIKRAYETKGKELVLAFEKMVTLAIIDEIWKEHLREMDDLKQYVQHAAYEQKDPLLVYKFESFNLFKQMLQKINKDVISFLFRANLPIEERKVTGSNKTVRTDTKNLKTSRQDNTTTTSSSTNTSEPQKTMPVRVEKKIGRNDPCPCGSGKKYKNCHGIGADS